MEIKNIILKSIYGELTDDEQAFLNNWLKEGNHVRLNNRIRKNIQEKKAVEYFADIDVEEALRNVRGSRDTSRQTKEHTRQTIFRRMFTPRIYRIAAIIALLIVGGAYWYHRDYTRVTPPVISDLVEMAMEQSQKSGMQGAEIITADNRKKPVVTQEELTRYHVDEHFAKQLADARRITTYHDKEYWVTLDDGTLVHLNYNSRLIYPEKFGDRRDVILEGEAYFMVAKDRSRQFVVHTPQGDVKVYGTEFNVNTRKEEGMVSVVLVEGSVSFTPTTGNERMMVPGQELTIIDSQLTLNNIDTAPYIAWNEGKFSFDDWPLERIMQVIGRWYGRTVEFTAEDIKTKTYSGNFDRYEDIRPTMEAIEMITGLKVTIKSDKIILEQ